MNLLLCFSLVCGLCTLRHGLFALPLGVIGKLYYAIVALLGHLGPIVKSIVSLTSLLMTNMLTVIGKAFYQIY